MRIATPIAVCMIPLLIACSHLGLARREMTAGEQLYRANCRSCHTLPVADAFTAEEWPELVKRYADRIELAEESQAKILQHLQDQLVAQDSQPDLSASGH